MDKDQKVKQVKSIVLEGYGGYDKIKVSTYKPTQWTNFGICSLNI